MNHIEVIGPPGAGKSTLQRQLITDGRLTGSGEHYPCILDAVPLLEKLSRIAGFGRAAERLGTLYWKYNSYDRFLVQFQNEFPRLFKVCETAGHLDERSHYPGMYYGAGAEFICFRNHSNETFVIDEGLPQLAPEVLSINQKLGRRFLQLLPVPDVIILMDCTAEECLRRQLDRKKPLASSLSNEDPEDAIDRLELYCTQFETTADRLKQRGARVVRVNTREANVEECLAEIQSAMNAGGQE